MKLKCPILLMPLDTIFQENYHAFYPSEPFRITRFKMRHPVLEDQLLLKFIYSQKATKFCEISTVDLSYVVMFMVFVVLGGVFQAHRCELNFFKISQDLIKVRNIGYLRLDTFSMYHLNMHGANCYRQTLGAGAYRDFCKYGSTAVRQQRNSNTSLCSNPSTN